MEISGLAPIISILWAFGVTPNLECVEVWQSITTTTHTHAHPLCERFHTLCERSQTFWRPSVLESAVPPQDSLLRREVSKTTKFWKVWAVWAWLWSVGIASRFSGLPQFPWGAWDLNKPLANHSGQSSGWNKSIFSARHLWRLLWVFSLRTIGKCLVTPKKDTFNQS